MAVQVRIPTPLRRITQGERVVQVDGGNLAQALDALDRRFPGIRAKILDERGEVLQFVNIFVNEQDIRFLAGLDTPLSEGAEVSIVPAMAGGTSGRPGP